MIFPIFIPFDWRVEGSEDIRAQKTICNIADFNAINYGNFSICDRAENPLLTILRICRLKILFRAFADDMLCFLKGKRNIQRKYYFAAEAVRRGTRDLYGAKEKDQFEVLKDEMYEGVTEVWEDEAKNGLAPLSVSYGRYSSVTRYRLMPKALLRSTISAGILGRYFLLKLVSPK